MQTQTDRFSSYNYGEGRTGIGQAVNFTCPLGAADQVREFLKANIRTIDIPTTGRVNISHGSYGMYTRYDITQHDYAGGGSGESGGYIEVLEITNPPDERWGIVINERIGRVGCVFTEWETLEDARSAFRKFWGSHNTAREFSKLQGFKRRVVCGVLTPWFCAIGNEQLLGDYTFPEGLQDDPVYRFGRKFVVFDENGIPSIKACMGTRFFNRKQDHYGHAELYRIVYWDDGSIWDESGRYAYWSSKYGSPRPLEEGDLWITEAVQQFHQLLAGRSAEFSINFTDGNKFVGRIVRAKSKSPCAEGDYFLIVHLKDKKSPIQGWIKGFKPTPEAPDIIEFVARKFASQGKEVERIEIKESKVKRGGKKWAGVFFHPPR
jgi:hypothetical protein